MIARVVRVVLAMAVLGGQWWCENDMMMMVMADDACSAQCDQVGTRCVSVWVRDV